jgi:hypothetical protein
MLVTTQHVKHQHCMLATTHHVRSNTACQQLHNIKQPHSTPGAIVAKTQNKSYVPHTLRISRRSALPIEGSMGASVQSEGSARSSIAREIPVTRKNQKNTKLREGSACMMQLTRIANPLTARMLPHTVDPESGKSWQRSTVWLLAPSKCTAHGWWCRWVGKWVGALMR